MLGAGQVICAPLLPRAVLCFNSYEGAMGHVTYALNFIMVHYLCHYSFVYPMFILTTAPRFV